jgi:uncharacterized protein (TIGR00251 family)
MITNVENTPIKKIDSLVIIKAKVILKNSSFFSIFIIDSQTLKILLDFKYMIIQAKVFPKSGREEIIKISENEFKIYLKKTAENNKANLELLKLLKNYFGGEAKIIKGLKSRNKIIEV